MNYKLLKNFLRNFFLVFLGISFLFVIWKYVIPYFLSNNEPSSGGISLKDLTIIIGGGGLVGLITKLFSWWRSFKDRVAFEKGPSKNIYPRKLLELVLRHYIEPFCQELEPCDNALPKKVYLPLFKTIDKCLKHPTEYKYILLLSDSGMGKTAFLINYYARNIRNRQREFEVLLLPLNLPNINKKIKQIINPHEVVLFLDGLDEDILANEDFPKRWHKILKLTRNFKKVLITCRTQFFPEEKSVPKKTGILKVGPRKIGESGQHLFHKIYITPFTDKQVLQYIKKKYPFWRPFRRSQALKIVNNIPDLSICPMVLTYIDELIKPKAVIDNKFSLYEEIVEAWLTREGAHFGIKKELLKEFFEKLAVDLWIHRKKRKAEYISPEEFAKLAEAYNIPVANWKLAQRSLLNRDSEGNIKFAHRSFLEFLFIKRFIKQDTKTRHIKWNQEMRNFLKSITDYKRSRGELIDFSYEGADIESGFLPIPIPLRNFPMKSLTKNKLKNMLRKEDISHDYNIYNIHSNNGRRKVFGWNGNFVFSKYVIIYNHEIVIVNDYITNLMWQQSGSFEAINYEVGIDYIAHLNNTRAGGYNNWRLPTLEEAMSLVEKNPGNKNLHIDRKFSTDQKIIWTADYKSEKKVWVVCFSNALCKDYNIDDNKFFVRAVRSCKEKAN